MNLCMLGHLKLSHTSRFKSLTLILEDSILGVVLDVEIEG